MPTNLVPWTPLGFFTNAADLLLRSQVFVYTNYVTNAAGVYYPSNYLLATFGITNIPVYNATNPGVCYNEQVPSHVTVGREYLRRREPCILDRLQ